MRLVSLEVSNFKAFQGTHRVQFPAPANGRNIYVIGGLNGSGKTSLAQSIVLATHGEQAGGLPALFREGRDRRKHYYSWLEFALNRTAHGRGDYTMRAAIELEDDDRRLSITRRWWFDAAGAFAEESLDVREESPTGTSLFAAAEAQVVIDTVLPRNLFDFAFFDGEQVRRLDDTLSASAVRAALDRLLELDAVERTAADIVSLAEERIASHATPAQHEELETAKARRDGLVESRRNLRKAIHDSEVLRDQYQHELDALSTSLTATLDGDIDATPARLNQDLARLREQRKELRARLGRQLGDWLYLLPAWSELPGLLSEVAGSREAMQDRDRAKLELQAVEDVTERLVKNRGLRKAAGKDAVEAVAEWLRADLARKQVGMDSTAPEVGAFPSLSDAELGEAQAQLESVSTRDLAEPAGIAADLERVEQRITDLTAALEKVSEGPGIEQLLRRRDELLGLLVEARVSISQAEDRGFALDSDLASVRGSLAGLEQRLNLQSTELVFVRTAERLGAALHAFAAERRAGAIAAVRDRMLAGIQQLFRKAYVIEDVEIDAETYVTRLIAKDGRAVELPSAGEHQLAAMAFVQAVLAASKNPVPVFVDTPLARLDSTHRAAVVSRFWPSLGRQVIVLSTDEEVVGELLEMIEPNLAEVYLVDSGPDGASSVRTGTYFDGRQS